MTDKEQIIIDGINVSGCNELWLNSANNYNSRCIRFKDVYSQCLYCKDNPSCEYKQLSRKTQECEELRVAYNKAQDILGRVNRANELKAYSLQESIKECDRYHKALEEIKNLLSMILNTVVAYIDKSSTSSTKQRRIRKMIRIFCDGCGKDMTTDNNRYTVTVQLSSTIYLDATIRKDVCEECKDKIFSILEGKQLSFEDTGKNECE